MTTLELWLSILRLDPIEKLLAFSVFMKIPLLLFEELLLACVDDVGKTLFLVGHVVSPVKLKWLLMSENPNVLEKMLLESAPTALRPLFRAGSAAKFMPLRKLLMVGEIGNVIVRLVEMNTKL